MIPRMLLQTLLFVSVLVSSTRAADAPSGARPAPPARHIVNIVHFVRGLEPRNPRLDLVEPVREQLRLARETGLPVTFLLQYDALLQSRFIDPIRAQAGDSLEVGGWLEIVQSLAEKAGLPWRGRFPWDWHADVGFTIGYTPEERELLVDAYMDEFRSVFGRYPRSVGAWFIDAPTLAYLARRYGVIATCMCREQVGNDGYTLWGGYWNGMYYPSRENAFMPAQRAENQIPISVFRMSGNDPIEQFASGMAGVPSGVRTLEPACPEGGGSPAWVRWYFRMHAHAPCLALSQVHVGQENAFGWPRMAEGLTDQMHLLAELEASGALRVETMEHSARWFQSRFPVTPATAVTALEDVEGLDRGSFWYSSRFYRVNFHWHGGSLRIRDIHQFDESSPEPFIARRTTEASCRMGTAAVFDELLWSTPGSGASLKPVRMGRDSVRRPLRVGRPRAQEIEDDALELVWPLAEGGELRVVCRESTLDLRCAGGPSAERWALAMDLGRTGAPIERTSDHALTIAHDGKTCVLRCTRGRFASTPDGRGFLMIPTSGRLVLDLRADD